MSPEKYSTTYEGYHMVNKNRFKKAAGLGASIVGLSALVSGAAHAEVPAALTTAVTSISTDATTLMDSATPVVFGIATAFVLWKIGKRVLGKI
jgi:mevalonate pyrophosphate decarboxylase